MEDFLKRTLHLAIVRWCCSCTDRADRPRIYVFNPPESSPAFILADAGFDVFLMNQRGTTYGRRHTTLSPGFGSKFWQFTQDDFAKYDATAVIDKVLEVSGHQSLHWVGHSQGTLIGFLTLAELPAYNSKYYRRELGAHEVLYQWSSLYRPLGRLCSLIPVLGHEVCYEYLHFLLGPPAKTFNMVRNYKILLITRIPVYLSHFPAGISTWSILHLAQVRNWETIGSLKHASQTHFKRRRPPPPPPYNYSNIDVPIYMYWSRNDWLTTADNIERNILASIRKDLL
ncbi:hypothetical protein PENTCL1PPCAC_24644 [Pristionchus entomophagus]|uniref:AB hydrolase-1 domain-containing protein n=1 Tax=Pristionchus entomophagus TaxID=358040 RepID=A0AAV5U7V6_9BILA|nr:hypothetical protein PENTCL1PPCAC_24644 [Pristionchus entomophagus]